MGRGKFSGDSENAKGKLIIGILIMAVLITAVVVLLVSSLGNDPPIPEADETPPVDTSPLPGESDNTYLDGTPVETPYEPPETPSESETPSPVVESVTITYNGVKKEDFTVKIGEKVPLKVKITPEGAEGTPEWSSSNTSVFDVLPNGTVTGIGKGDATLTVTVEGVSATCIVRCNGKT